MDKVPALKKEFFGFQTVACSDKPSNLWLGGISCISLASKNDFFGRNPNGLLLI